MVRCTKNGPLPIEKLTPLREAVLQIQIAERSTIEEAAAEIGVTPERLVGINRGDKIDHEELVLLRQYYSTKLDKYWLRLNQNT